MKKKSLLALLFVIVLCLPALAACNGDQNEVSGTLEEATVAEETTLTKDTTVSQQTTVAEDTTIIEETTVPEEHIVSDGWEFFSNGDGTYYVKLTGYPDGYPNIVVPTLSPNGYKVTGIGEDGFLALESLLSVVIPDSIESIDYSAFSGCIGIESITVDENNKHYKSIDGNLYSKDGTILIKYAVGKKDTKFIMPDSATAICCKAFLHGTSLTSITISEGVTIIPDFAFAHCINLESVIIPEGVTSIGEASFAYCENLESIIIPDGVTSIGNSSFTYCKNLVNVVLPDSITSIGISAFQRCTSLKKIIISDSVTRIESRAFENCISLENIIIPDSVVSIDEGAFGGCANISETENGITYVDRWAVYGDENITEAILRNNTVGIAGATFINCDELISITIPNNVKAIGDLTFFFCRKLENISVDPNNAHYKDVDGDLYSKDGSVLVRYACAKLNSSFDVLDGVKFIDPAAFAYSLNLTEITLPNSVYSIGADAFRGCKSLTKINIPDEIHEIGDRAFQFCTSLDNVYVGNCVERIGDRAFSDCYNMTYAVISDSVTSIGEHIFDNCEKLEKVHYPGTEAEWSEISMLDNGYLIYYVVFNYVPEE